jgi:PAS domain S-box-containing protein
MDTQPTKDRDMYASETETKFDKGTFESIFEYAVEGIFQTLPDGRYLRVNPALSRIYGYQSPEELLSDLTDIAHQLYVEPERRNEFMTMMEEFDVVNDFVSEIRCKDGGTRWISENARAVRELSGDLKYYEGFVVDITEKIESEKRQKKLELEFQQIQHMSALGTLAGGISHDFKTLLTIIDGHTEMALEKTGKDMDAAVDDHLEHISRVVQRGIDIVERIDGFSRDADEIKEAVRVDVLVKDVIRMLRAVAAPSIDIRHEIELDVGTVLASPNQIFQVVLNLCTNAFRALGEGGGVLHLGLKMIEADGKYPPGLKAGKYLGFTVSDDGVGMDDALTEKVYELGVTTKEHEPISGFGLGIVKGIVQGLDGDITVQSEPGNGTTFSIYLPVHEEEKETILSRLSSRFQETLTATMKRT